MSPAPAWPHGRRPRVCVSLAESDPEALRGAFEMIGAADLAEIRLDALADSSLDTRALADLVATCPVPVGFTLRPTWQGGAYVGAEADRRYLLGQAAEAGAAFVDIELDAEWAADFIDSSRCPVIVSHHWLESPAVDLEERVRRARDIGASVVKLVGTAVVPTDALPLLRAGRQLVDERPAGDLFLHG